MRCATADGVLVALSAGELCLKIIEKPYRFLFCPSFSYFLVRKISYLCIFVSLQNISYTNYGLSGPVVTGIRERSNISAGG